MKGVLYVNKTMSRSLIAFHRPSVSFISNQCAVRRHGSEVGYPGGKWKRACMGLELCTNTSRWCPSALQRLCPLLGHTVRHLDDQNAEGQRGSPWPQNSISTLV